MIIDNSILIAVRCCENIFSEILILLLIMFYLYQCIDCEITRFIEFVFIAAAPIINPVRGIGIEYPSSH